MATKKKKFIPQKRAYGTDKDWRLQVRVNSIERAEIARRAAMHKPPLSVSDYVRQAALGQL